MIRFFIYSDLIFTENKCIVFLLNNITFNKINVFCYD